MPIRMEKPMKAFISSTVVVQVGRGPSPWCVADMHCSPYLFVSLTIWSRSSGVNRAKNVVVGSPKGWMAQLVPKIPEC